MLRRHERTRACVTDRSAHSKTWLVAMNSQYDRKITVLRVEKNGDDPDGCLEELLEHYELSSTPEDTHQN